MPHLLRKPAAAVLMAQAAILGTSFAAADVPQTLTEQGRLFDASGNPINATDTLTFSLYTTAAGGAEITPREAVRSVPYAIVSSDAIGNIHPATVTVNGTLLIDATGTWV